MPITVRNDPSYATVGKSAYNIGVGTRDERVSNRQEDMDRDLLKMKLAEQAQVRALSANMYNADANREIQSRQLDQGDRAADFAEQKYNEAPSRALQKGLEEKKRMQEQVEWEYTETQKRELDKINNAVAWVREQVADGTWTAEQGEDAEQQLWAKHNGVVPLPKYMPKVPTKAEIFAANTVTDGFGNQYFMDEKGKLTPLENPDQITNKEILEIQEKVTESFTTVDYETKATTTAWDKVDAEVKRQLISLQANKQMLANLQDPPKEQLAKDFVGPPEPTRQEKVARDARMLKEQMGGFEKSSTPGEVSPVETAKAVVSGLEPEITEALSKYGVEIGDIPSEVYGEIFKRQLNNKIVAFQKVGKRLIGEASDKTKAERIAQMVKNAHRATVARLKNLNKTIGKDEARRQKDLDRLAELRAKARS